jgi:glycosyltransferase involved in cell wall biosynthesis
MNILMIPHLYLPNIGGVEIAVSNLTNCLKKNKHNVEIITSLWPKNLPKTSYINNIKVSRLAFRIPSFSIKHLISFLYRAPVCIIKLLKVAKITKFDIINLHYVSENALYALILSVIKKIPLVTNIHGADIEDLPYRNKFNKIVLKFALKHSEIIFSNSKSMINQVNKLFRNQFSKKIITVGNGINIEEFDSSEKFFKKDYSYIIGVGRFVKKKGFDILIKAFSIVQKKYPNLNLILIGDGTERANLEKLRDDMKMNNSIHFLGGKSHEETIKYIKGSEFFVLPSRKEPFGIVCLEAMAAKKAVVAMNVGGVSEYLKHTINGMLVENERSEDLANSIIYLIDNPELSKKFGLNGRKLVETNYTWDSISQKYIKVFSYLL